MYDPTIFENLKVTFENQVYDLDNLEHQIKITNRMDRMDFAVLSRDFSIGFTLTNQPNVAAEIILQTSLEDLAGEILEQSGQNLGCFLLLRFHKHVQDVPTQCKKIEQALHTIWENEAHVTQTLSFIYEQDTSSHLNNIQMQFNKKINEEHISDIPEFLEHVLQTLKVLNEI
ncbi:hypothetical protein PB01_17620 [Psychrobacillus glaciei]|uniref:Group-specific protein n=1 Tax=Psychrobacillus glaciei TaxID=2283160 RepID=A0A5J6SU13_9BACI|nr:hypothetical protein [Psychrobacillus glaciei]QFG00475.1 hypothetical protein PB01_17620 [Psychrobacillus glaciei]